MAVLDHEVPYLTCEQIATKYNLAPGTVRWLLYNRESNGLNKAVCKIGLLVRINENKWLEWLEERIEAK